mmetsp:Transcript_2804/g.8544  ORF Transcript_2804/g.8544 Transcript_2804/m.8544 type:complete len:275 (-) Transcript_2804:1628-2452(-)
MLALGFHNAPIRLIEQRRRVGVCVCAVRDRSKIDKAPDAFFYSTPRLVRHADSGWHEKLTALYREKLPPNGDVLDLMSSWVSHYPEDMSFRRISATGMNREELSQNSALTDFVVHDLNANPNVPYEDNSFDAITCALSVQYLQEPERVFEEIARVLRPRGVAIFSFSNRMFFTKAIADWKNRSGRGRTNLVKSYFASCPAFTEAEAVVQTSPLTLIAPQLALFGLPYGGDPFYAVYAHKFISPSAADLEEMRSGKVRYVYLTGKRLSSLRQTRE